jgi:hypothetical protein
MKVREFIFGAMIAFNLTWIALIIYKSQQEANAAHKILVDRSAGIAQASRNTVNGEQ